MLKHMGQAGVVDGAGLENQVEHAVGVAVGNVHGQRAGLLMLKEHQAGADHGIFADLLDLKAADHVAHLGQFSGGGFFLGLHAVDHVGDHLQLLLGGIQFAGQRLDGGGLFRGFGGQGVDTLLGLGGLGGQQGDLLLAGVGLLGQHLDLLGLGGGVGGQGLDLGGLGGHVVRQGLDLLGLGRHVLGQGLNVLQAGVHGLLHGGKVAVQILDPVAGAHGGDAHQRRRGQNDHAQDGDHFFHTVSSFVV